jgi:hypothetical protein
LVGRWSTESTAAGCTTLKELRPGSAGRLEIRLLFVFDVEREAVILVAGDKMGQWNRWYRENIPVAEDRYEEYLAERKNEEAS